MESRPSSFRVSSRERNCDVGLESEERDRWNRWCGRCSKLEGIQSLSAMEGFDGSPGLASLDENAHHVRGDYTEMEGEEQTLRECARDSTAGRGGGERGQGRSGGGRALRGYNWTEHENLILIEQKRLEHEERHRRGAASGKFVYGKEAWRIVTERCNAQVGFRERDQNQVSNKWDALGKEFKRIRDYLGSSEAVEWWSLSKADKKDLARTRKLPLEFTEAMYKALEPWHGQRTIMGNCMGSIVDTERDTSSQPVANQSGRGRGAGKAAASSPGSTVPGSNVATGSPSPMSRTERPDERAATSCPGDVVPATSTATATPLTPSSAPSEGRTRSSNAPAPSTEPDTPEDGTRSSAGRKRKAAETGSFERDSYHDYLSPAEAQEAEERVWRSSVLKFHSDCEARLASKDAQAATMEERLYQLEVKRTARMERIYELEMQKQVNIGNMTNALLKMANSIENMTRVLLDKSR